MQGVRFEPTEEQRRTVRAMSGFGIPQEDIATFLEIEPKTLRRHFRRELDRGMVEATAKVAQSLFQMATTGNNVAAAIFWMKARAGWREKQELRVGPTQMDQMTDAELERILQHVRDEIAEADELAAEAAQLTAEQQPPSQ
ncbi:hypothetical protein [Elioraea rosea]|uniref:hypothetical protein n=1 Tax=Elioraea rosea TaxID=2492390 RepID=UPI001181DDEB|nr:hypothetical protein [Elioraea rosea]